MRGAELSALRSLDISVIDLGRWCGNAEIAVFVSLFTGSAMPLLEHLAISGDSFSTSDMASLSSSAPCLRSLSLRQCKDISPPRVLETLTGLRRLSIFHKVVSAWGTHPEMFTPAVTDSLTSVPIPSASLHTLEIEIDSTSGYHNRYHARKTTDVFSRLLGLSTNVRELKFAYAKYIEVGMLSLSSLLVAFVRLERLELAGAGGHVTDDLLMTLAASPMRSTLCFLDVRECVVTLSALEIFALGFDVLRTIMLEEDGVPDGRHELWRGTRD
jgi:hypothetical protein